MSALTLTVERANGIWRIADAAGGVWWATAEASAAIDAAGDEDAQRAECLRLEREDVSAGRWRS